MNLFSIWAKTIHSHNVKVGWWDEWPNKADRFHTARVLVASEISEALEGWRKHLMDEHLPEYPAFDVELADAMIRLLDMAGAYDVDIKLSVLEILSDDFTRKNMTVPEQLDLVMAFLYVTTDNLKFAVFSGIAAVAAVAALNGVELWKLIEAKHHYNLRREDHTREARSEKHGKKI